MSRVHISSTIQNPPKRLPIDDIKNAILGARYELSLVYIGTTRAKTLNEQYRHKSYIPNILSFPLETQVGEMFICPVVAAREAKKFNLSPRGYICFLFIHGCLHLKGYPHGATMDRLERKYLKAFNIS